MTSFTCLAIFFDKKPKVVGQNHIAEYIANKCHLHLVMKQENEELTSLEVHIQNNGEMWLMKVSEGFSLSWPYLDNMLFWRGKDLRKKNV